MRRYSRRSEFVRSVIILALCSFCVAVFLWAILDLSPTSAWIDGYISGNLNPDYARQIPSDQMSNILARMRGELGLFAASVFACGAGMALIWVVQASARDLHWPGAPRTRWLWLWWGMLALGILAAAAVAWLQFGSAATALELTVGSRMDLGIITTAAAAGIFWLFTCLAAPPVGRQTVPLGPTFHLPDRAWE